jgi:hypothetical protein
MTQIRIPDLTGLALDWTVLRTRFPKVELHKDALLNGRVMSGLWVKNFFHDPNRWIELKEFPFSTQPGWGQPILEGKKISLLWRKDIDGGVWWATAHDEPEDEEALGQLGPTQLIAGLRCYIMSSVDDEFECVEVPEELL